jgi:hypothetical protein
MSDVTITFAGERLGPPPTVRLLVDVTAANPSSELRWVLIPTRLPAGATSGVDKLEQLTATTGALGRFLGTGGFYGVALAPGARLTIKNLPIEWWNDADAKAPPAVDVRLATDVSLGGTSIATWFAGAAPIAGTVELDAGTAEHTRSHRAPDDREVDVTLVGGQTLSIPLAR